MFCNLYEEYCRQCSTFDRTPLPYSVAYSNAMEMCRQVSAVVACFYSFIFRFLRFVVLGIFDISVAYVAAVEKLLADWIGVV